MATITNVRTIKFVAQVLEEDPELLQAIVSNEDNLSYGNIITVYTGDDESVTALTDDGMEERADALTRSPLTRRMKRLPRQFRRRRKACCSHQSEISAVTIGRLPQIRRAMNENWGSAIVTSPVSLEVLIKMGAGRTTGIVHGNRDVIPDYPVRTILAATPNTEYPL